MLPTKFIGFVLNGVPNFFNWIGKKVRTNEVNNIEKAVAIGDDKYINAKLQSVKDKYEADAKARS